jgi:tRNA (guanine26-N2/guanine27-N2)-dimethyltransferase
MGYLHYCDLCGNRQTEKAAVSRGATCAYCKKRMAGYGRLWLGPLKDEGAVSDAYKFAKGADMEESEMLLHKIKSECDAPFYYHIPTMTKRLRIGAVSPRPVMDSLLESGFVASYAHASPSSIKTDADIEDVVSRIREAARKAHRDA